MFPARKTEASILIVDGGALSEAVPSYLGVGFQRIHPSDSHHPDAVSFKNGNVTVSIQPPNAPIPITGNLHTVILDGASLYQNDRGAALDIVHKVIGHEDRPTIVTTNDPDAVLYSRVLDGLGRNGRNRTDRITPLMSRDIPSLVAEKVKAATKAHNEATIPGWKPTSASGLRLIYT